MTSVVLTPPQLGRQGLHASAYPQETARAPGKGSGPFGAADSAQAAGRVHPSLGLSVAFRSGAAQKGEAALVWLTQVAAA